MTENGFIQIFIYLISIILLVKPLGWYMARVFQDQPCGLNRVLKPVELFIYRICSIPQQGMNWKQYAFNMLLFNLMGILLVYTLERLQFFLPFNPQHFPGISPDLALNTAISFTTNTNWQNYSGESTLSYLTQMSALTVQNFLSAASGLAILVAFIRGITNHETENLGNFWVDIIRSVLYILLPLSLIFALLLVSQGVIQNFSSYKTISLLQPTSYLQPVTDAQGQVIKDAAGQPQIKAIPLTQQTIPFGPVASQVAIKQLGTNGGGFFNANSAHPFENPTPFSNFLEMLALILIPAALCYTYGVMVNDKRQGWAIFAAMAIIFIPLLFMTVYAEYHDIPTALTNAGFFNGNMEGKELRFGIVNSGIWATTTTATANGSVNAMHDSLTPLGGLIPLWLMQLSEVIFGGVGSGLYTMLIMVIVAVFIAGLMVGRTPEYLGKKIEIYEIKMASIVVLLMPCIVLLITAIATVTSAGNTAIANPGAHGFTEILYAFTSMANNNGSALAGLNSNTIFYNALGGIAMLIGRYWVAIPILAIAGSLAKKRTVPPGLGTLPTHTLLFIILLVCVVLIIGALTFFPALTLGPIAEQLMM